MHNQRRDEYKARLRDPKTSAAIAQKAYQYKTLSKELLSRRLKQRDLHRGDDGASENAAAKEPEEVAAVPPAGVEEALKLTEKILSVNPDPGHLWNHRRELLLLPSSSTQLTSESLFDMHNELTLTAKCLERNPKAYGAWHHRKWSIRRHLRSAEDAGEEEEEKGNNFLPLLRSELDLCGQFLTHDERNFHCWNYRRFVVSALGWCHVLQQQSKVQQGQQTETTLDGSWNWIGFGIGANETIMGPQLASSVDDECQGEVGDGGGDGEGDSSGNDDDDSFLDQLLEAEWDFTTHKIASNFSNGSAFHHRSKLLPLMLDVRCKDRARDAATATADGVEDEEEEDTKEELEESRIEEIIEECYDEALDLARVELDLIRNATFTEPDDQTPWWYHRFVISWCHPKVALSSWGQSGIVTTNMIESYVELIHDEIESVRELIDAEETCKWGRLALHMLMTILMDNAGNNMGTRTSKEGGDEEDIEEEGSNDDDWMMEEANECLDELVKMDPDRIVRYESMRRR